MLQSGEITFPSFLDLIHMNSKAKSCVLSFNVSYEEAVRGYGAIINGEQFSDPRKTLAIVSAAAYSIALPEYRKRGISDDIALSTFTDIPRWEEEYEHAEHAPADYQFEVRLVLEAREHVLAQRHGPYEIQAQQAAGDAEQNVGRHPFYRPRSIEVEREQRRRAAEDVCKACRGDAGY